MDPIPSTHDFLSSPSDETGHPLRTCSIRRFLMMAVLWLLLEDNWMPPIPQRPKALNFRA